MRCFEMVQVLSAVGPGSDTRRLGISYQINVLDPDQAAWLAFIHTMLANANATGTCRWWCGATWGCGAVGLWVHGSEVVHDGKCVPLRDDIACLDPQAFPLD